MKHGVSHRVVRCVREKGHTHRDVEGRAGARRELGRPRAGAGRGLRVHRAVLRRPAAVFGPRLPEGGTTAMTASPALPGGASAKARAVEALGATRRRGAAISVSPPAPSVNLISSIPGILEAAPPTPVGTRAACLLTP